MRIFYGGIAYRSVDVAHHEAVLSFQEECLARGIAVDRCMITGVLISRSRSIVASNFLRSEADVLLTIDSDIVFRAQDAISLCEKALKYDLIGGCYATRGSRRKVAALLPHGEAVVFANNEEPLQVRYLAAGFMAISRSVVEKIRDTLPLCDQGTKDTPSEADLPFWPFYMPYVIPVKEKQKNVYLSEDVAFCERAKGVGFKMWLDPTIRLGHVGDYMFLLEDLIRPERPEAQPMTLTQQNGYIEWCLQTRNPPKSPSRAERRRQKRAAE